MAKKIQIELIVPEFYKIEDFLVALEVGLSETCALVECDNINGKYKSITADMKIKSIDKLTNQIELIPIEKV